MLELKVPVRAGFVGYEQRHYFEEEIRVLPALLDLTA